MLSMLSRDGGLLADLPQTAPTAAPQFGRHSWLAWKYFRAMAIDPNLTFAGISVGGLLLALTAIRSLKQEVKSMVLESDDFRDRSKALAVDVQNGCHLKDVLTDLKARVRTLEAQAGYKLKETGAISREAVQ